MANWFLRAGAHVAKWGARLEQLRGAKVECLEAAIWLSALGLFTLFAMHLPFAVLTFMTELMPRGAWMTMTAVLFLLSFFGYLEDNIHMRRLGGFCSMVFWGDSGLYLYKLAPYAMCLHLTLAVLWSWVWTRIGEEDSKRRIRAIPMYILAREKAKDVEAKSKEAIR